MHLTDIGLTPGTLCSNINKTYNSTRVFKASMLLSGPLTKAHNVLLMGAADLCGDVIINLK